MVRSTDRDIDGKMETLTEREYDVLTSMAEAANRLDKAGVPSTAPEPEFEPEESVGSFQQRAHIPYQKLRDFMNT